MIIIRDTREKTPWEFSHCEEVSKVQACKLDEGDYTTKEVLRLEQETGRKIVRIERKASTVELSLNLGRNRATFERELERLSEYEYKYLLMEFSEDELYLFPKGSGIPKNKMYRKNKKGNMVLAIKMNGPYMIKLLHDYRDKYGIELIFANDRDRAEQIAMELLNADFKKA